MQNPGGVTRLPAACTWAVGRKLPSLLGFGALLMLSGCFDFKLFDGCDDCGNYDEPVYMSYQTLRSTAIAQQPKTPSEISRIYLYHDLVLLNSRNQGIHVYDNADPQNPQNLVFINIPGNTELSVIDNYLYADSFIDLVVYDISDVNNIHEVNRQTGIFPYDPYQVIDDDSVYFESIDETRGVVVGHE